MTDDAVSRCAARRGRLPPAAFWRSRGRNAQRPTPEPCSPAHCTSLVVAAGIDMLREVLAMSPRGLDVKKCGLTDSNEIVTPTV
eukprot:10931758-Lingulodinium_polyedra.AAC.1